jgi:ATP-dependent DNA helicase Rep
MSTSFSHGLNLAQQDAVNFLHGPCLVLAGAGSGKTRVITHKIGRLIQAGLEPKRIAAITFTNKAATEMRERAKGLIGKAAKDVRICTFHALGVHLLREDGEAVGLKPKFSILDSDDVTGILKDAGGSTDAATARQWQWTISLWKNMGLNAAQAEAQAADDNERITARIMARYEERLAAYQSVDFDDLIGLPLKLLRDMPRCGPNGRRSWATSWLTSTRTPTPRSTTCSSCWCRPTRRTRASPPWATTTSPSTAGVAPRWTT